MRQQSGHLRAGTALQAVQICVQNAWAYGGRVDSSIERDKREVINGECGSKITYHPMAGGWQNGSAWIDLKYGAAEGGSAYLL